jgi:hypothetical protein
MSLRELTPGLTGDLQMVEVTLNSSTEIARLVELGREANKLANAKIWYIRNEPLMKNIRVSKKDPIGNKPSSLH